MVPAISTGSYPASRVMTPSNGSKTDSDLLGGSSCEIAVERGRRILLAMEKPQNEGRENKPPHIGPASDTSRPSGLIHADCPRVPDGVRGRPSANVL